MPRDANGNYTLPSGNPVVSGANIESVWANTTMADIKQALTDSLDRQGRGGMVGSFKFDNGSVSQPSVTFTAEPSSGLYWAGLNDVRMTIGGTGGDRMRWTATGAEVFGTLSRDAKQVVTSEDGEKPNITRGTADPAGGADGDIYFQHT